MNPIVFTFDLPIWKIVYDTGSSTTSNKLLLLELRDKNQVQWAILDTQQMEILWQRDLADWWWSVVAFENNKIHLHQYDDAEQFVPKKRLTINASTGIIEQQNTYQYSIKDPVKNIHWKTSIAYEEDNPYYSKICEFIVHYTSQNPHKTINYGEYFGNIIVVYYFYNSNTFTLSRSILVVHKSKYLHLHQIIPLDVDGGILNEFLYDSNNIIYLHKPNEISVLKWSKS